MFITKHVIKKWRLAIHREKVRLRKVRAETEIRLQFSHVSLAWLCGNDSFFLRTVKLQTFSYKINHFPNIVPLTPWPISRVFVQEQRIRGTEIEMRREERGEVSADAHLKTQMNIRHWEKIIMSAGLISSMSFQIFVLTLRVAHVRIESHGYMYVDLIKHSLVARMCRVFSGNLKWCCQSSWLTAELCRAVGLVSGLDTGPGLWKTILITGTGTLDKIWFSSSLFSPRLKYFTLNTQDEIGWYISPQNSW